MEKVLYQVLVQGGWFAIGTVLIYLFLKLEKRLEKLEEKINEFQSHYITKDTYYRDVSGWRGEIHRLEDKIDKMLLR